MLAQDQAHNMIDNKEQQNSMRSQSQSGLNSKYLCFVPNPFVPQGTTRGDMHPFYCGMLRATPTNSSGSTPEGSGS